MKASNSGKGLNELFEKARNSPELINLEDVELFINGAVIKKTSRFSGLSSTFKIILMSSLVLIISAILYFSTDKKVIPNEISFRKLNTEKRFIVAQKHVDSAEIKHPINKIPQKNNTRSFNAEIDKAAVSAHSNFSGISYVEFDKPMLKRLGVVAFKSGINVPLSSGDDAQHLIFTMDGCIIGFNEAAASESGFTAAEAKEILSIQSSRTKYPCPRYITDDLGQNLRASVTEDSSSKDEGEIKNLQKNLSVLVAVLVKSTNIFSLQDSIDGKWRPDLILWYRPEDILANIPVDVAEEIQTEKEILMNEKPLALLDTGENQNELLSKECKYFEACKSDQILKSSVLIYPNPGHGKLSVSVDLKEKRTLHIFVSDINGRILTEPRQEIQEASKKSYDFDISALPEGIYLMNIITDKNERFTQRIVKE